MNSLDATSAILWPTPSTIPCTRSSLIVSPSSTCAHKGSRISPRCVGLVASIEGADVTELCARKWSIPILVALGSGLARFGELRSVLAPASDRARSLALRELSQGGLIERVVVDEYTLGVAYQVKSPGRAIARAGRSLVEAAQE